MAPVEFVERVLQDLTDEDFEVLLTERTSSARDINSGNSIERFRVHCVSGREVRGGLVRPLCMSEGNTGGGWHPINRPVQGALYWIPELLPWKAS